MKGLKLILCFFWCLAACGGGASSSTSQPTPSAPTATAVDLANAKAANLTAALDATTKIATLKWSDTFPAGTPYAVEQKDASGVWSTIDSVPGTGGAGASLSWARTTNVSTTLRVAAQKTGYEVPLDTPAGSTDIAITVPTTLPTIQFDQNQPVSGVVNVSISGGSGYSSVDWYVDLNLLGSSSSAPAYSVALNTSSLTAGSHLILARVQTAPGSYLELRQTVQVANPEVAVQVGVSGTSGTVSVNVTATSVYGIASVSAAIDGQPLGTLSAPNCAGLGCGNGYQFSLNTSVVGSGAHTITATATDTAGVSASSSISITFSNPPVVAVNTPIDGAIVNGTLAIAGTVTTDQTNATVSVSATLGSLPILTSAASSFSSSFSLAGVTPGTYTLTVVATDSSGLASTVTRQVTVASSAALVYTPVLTLGAGASVLAATSTNVVYAAADASIHVHTATSDTLLSQAGLTNLTGWQIADNGYVVAQGFGTDRPGGATSIYGWAPGNSIATNLSNLAVSQSIYDQALPMHYPWVLWASLVSSNWNQYTLYNLVTGQTLIVPAPPGVLLVGNNSCDFTTTNGQLTLFYWAELEDSSQHYTTNVYRWDQATNASQPITADGVSLYPQTDGMRIAWQTDHSAPPPQAPFTLSVESIASAGASVLSTSMSNFQLSGGVLAWVDQTVTTSALGVSTVTAQAIRASDGSTTSTLSGLLTSALFGTSGGYVAYEESGKLYDWSPSGGKTLLFDATPGQVHLTGSTLYFTNGTTQALYSIPMH